MNTTACPAGDGAAPLRPSFAEIPRDQDRHAHGELRGHKGHKIQNLAAGRDGGKPGGRAKLPHNQQVDRTIGRLQNERAQYRKHEQRQLFQDAALRKIVIQG